MRSSHLLCGLTTLHLTLLGFKCSNCMIHWSVSYLITCPTFYHFHTAFIRWRLSLLVFAQVWFYDLSLLQTFFTALIFWTLNSLSVFFVSFTSSKPQVITWYIFLFEEIHFSVPKKWLRWPKAAQDQAYSIHFFKLPFFPF